MPKPCPDGVDIHASTKQMSRRGMANRMGTNTLVGQARHLHRGPFGIAFDQGMNAKPGDRSATAVEKDVLSWLPSLNPRGEFACRVGPERATAPFIALAPELNRGGLPLRSLAKPQVPNPKLRGFIGAGACIVKKQQEPIVSPPLCGATIRSTEQRIHFRFFQKGGADADHLSGKSGNGCVARC